MGDCRRNVRPADMMHVETATSARTFIDNAISELSWAIGDSAVLLAYSGGVASCVSAAMLKEAVGDRLTCLLVNHGLFRKEEPARIAETFRRVFGSRIEVVNAEDTFLEDIEGKSDSNEINSMVGTSFERLFAGLAAEHKAHIIALGTNHEDIIISRRDVPTHHSVIHQPFGSEIELVEPVRLLFRDEICVVGRELGLPDVVIKRQPFPGIGLGARCIGVITRERLAVLREADAITRDETEEMRTSLNYYCTLDDSCPINANSSRENDGYTVTIRALDASNTRASTPLFYDAQILERIRNRILDEIPRVNRVLYDFAPVGLGSLSAI